MAWIITYVLSHPSYKTENRNKVFKMPHRGSVSVSEKGFIRQKSNQNICLYDRIQFYSTPGSSSVFCLIVSCLTQGLWWKYQSIRLEADNRAGCWITKPKLRYSCGVTQFMSILSKKLSKFCLTDNGMLITCLPCIDCSLLSSTGSWKGPYFNNFP